MAQLLHFPRLVLFVYPILLLGVTLGYPQPKLLQILNIQLVAMVRVSVKKNTDFHNKQFTSCNQKLVYGQIL